MPRFETVPTDYEDCYLPNRAFGVELETDVYLGFTPDCWDSCEDGSVNGLEYKCGPILGKSAINLIESGCKSILEYYYNGTYDNSLINKKCGYHIHIDSRDLTELNVLRVIQMCKKFENSFYGLVPKSRLDGYSSPIKDTILSTTDLEEFLYGEYKEDKHSRGHSMRYVWCNVHSYYYRGTIEIRLHSGTLNAEKVLRWAELWLKLIECVKNNFVDMAGAETIWDLMMVVGVRDSTIKFYKERNIKLHGGPVEVIRESGRPSLQRV